MIKVLKIYNDNNIIDLKKYDLNDIEELDIVNCRNLKYINDLKQIKKLYIKIYKKI